MGVIPYNINKNIKYYIKILLSRINTLMSMIVKNYKRENMPQFNLLFQGKSKESNHLDAFHSMISAATDIEEIIISSAFVRSEGISLLLDPIEQYNDKIRIYLGIRNGITSVQSLFSLVNKSIETYTIDTASPAILYHPKIFGIKTSSEISLLIGSANLTSGGLYRNIEASFLFKDSINEDSLNLWNQYKESLNFLIEDCKENVTKIETYKTAFEMYLDGLLINERISVKPKIEGIKKRNIDNKTKSIKLNTKKFSVKKHSKKKTMKRIAEELNINNLALLWEVFPLTERDLNIPSGQNTHSTGDMNFKKGLLEDIDQRHYFRDVIFNDLNWIPDSSRPHLERAFANFKIIIKGINHGTFNLRITHNTNTDTQSYRQNNCMTKFSWGDAKNIIANRELLECRLRMYKPKDNSMEYILEFI